MDQVSGKKCGSALDCGSMPSSWSSTSAMNDHDQQLQYSPDMIYYSFNMYPSNDKAYQENDLDLPYEFKDKDKDVFMQDTSIELDGGDPGKLFDYTEDLYDYYNEKYHSPDNYGPFQEEHRQPVGKEEEKEELYTYESLNKEEEHYYWNWNGTIYVSDAIMNSVQHCEKSSDGAKKSNNFYISHKSDSRDVNYYRGTNRICDQDWSVSRVVEMFSVGYDDHMFEEGERMFKLLSHPRNLSKSHKEILKPRLWWYIPEVALHHPDLIVTNIDSPNFSLQELRAGMTRYLLSLVDKSTKEFSSMYISMDFAVRWFSYYLLLDKVVGFPRIRAPMFLDGKALVGIHFEPIDPEYKSLWSMIWQGKKLMLASLRRWLQSLLYTIKLMHQKYIYHGNLDSAGIYCHPDSSKPCLVFFADDCRRLNLTFKEIKHDLNRLFIRLSKAIGPHLDNLQLLYLKDMLQGDLTPLQALKHPFFYTVTQPKDHLEYLVTIEEWKRRVLLSV